MAKDAKQVDPVEPAATVQLSQPVMVHGEEVSFLEFREPTSKDMIDLDMPLIFTSTGDVRMDMSISAKYIVRLAGVPVSAVEKMKRSDFLECAQVVYGFFQ